MHTFHTLKKSCPLRIRINKTCSIISRNNTQYSASCALAQVPLGMIPLLEQLSPDKKKQASPKSHARQWICITGSVSNHMHACLKNTTETDY